VPKETQHLLHKWGSSFLEKNRILRQCKGTRVQLVVPNKLRSLILIELHEKMGHLGFHHSQDVQESAFIGLTCRELMKIILIMSVSVQNGAPDTKEQGAATARHLSNLPPLTFFILERVAEVRNMSRSLGTISRASF